LTPYLDHGTINSTSDEFSPNLVTQKPLFLGAEFFIIKRASKIFENPPFFSL